MGMLLDVGLVTFVSSSLSAGAGAFLGSYLKKKGENLATKEDLGDLLKQVQAVTAATKEIEAKISNQVWDRQKQWEMKRDALYAVAQSMTAAVDALIELHSFYDVENKRGRPTPPDRQEKQLTLERSFNNAAATFHNAVLVAGLVCGKDVQKAAYEMEGFLRKMGVLAPKSTFEFLEQNTKEMVERRQLVITAIRRDLGVDPDPTPQSSVSLAAPNPGSQDPEAKK
jgi:hypothetical protein